MSDIIFEAKSIQTGVFKTLFEVLKEVLLDLNLIVTNTGIKIRTMNNKNETSFMHITLDAENFQSYYCECTSDDPLILGIHTSNMFKIIKTIKHDETITFLVKKSSPYALFIKKEHAERNSINVFKLQLHSIPNKEYEEFNIEMDTHITMSSTEFQRICKDYYNLGCKYIEIKNTGNQLFFSSIGDFSEIDTVLGNSDSTVVVNKNIDYITQGKFDILFLLLFSKASKLSTVCELSMKNDSPIILTYNIGTLGTLKFIISLFELE